MKRTLKVNKRNFVTLQNFIGGKFFDSKGKAAYETINPATQEVISHVPETTKEEFDLATENCKEAYKSWKNVPLLTRQRYMGDYARILRENKTEIAHTITKEHGKILSDAISEVQRGVEVVDQAVNICHVYMGETIENIASHVDIYSYRHPLGVTAGICPFNFPAMIPLWIMPYAITCGNTFLFKPSEKVANTSQLLIKYLSDIGLPAGVVNMVHGGKDQVERICHHPDIKAISFVGGCKAGEYVYETGTKNGKRVQANLGAKNHVVIMEDADKKDAIRSMVHGCIASSGQKCMSLSVVLLVGETQSWIADIAEKMKNVKIGNGLENKVELGPVISKQSKERILNIINIHEKEGGKVYLDGRKTKVENFESGNFIGPTILTEGSLDGIAYKEELFGPLLLVINVKDLEEAMKIINKSKLGNGASIFTKSGANARKFQRDLEQGQIGINIHTPIPLPMFSFTGNKNSFRGDINFYGKGGVYFNTQWKTVMSRWKPENEASQKINLNFPVLKYK